MNTQPTYLNHRLSIIASGDRAVSLLDAVGAAPVVHPARHDVHALVVGDPEVRIDAVPVRPLPVAVLVRAADHLAACEVERPADVRVRAVVELGVVDRDVPDSAGEMAGIASDDARGVDAEGKRKD